jgi:prepilin-type N-terminal cleavage/methylation domain-containing protein
MPRNKRHSRPPARLRPRGFSLVEALVSSAVLGVGMLGVLNVLSFSQSGAAGSGARSAAKELASQRLEALTTMVADRLPACEGTVGCRADETTLRPPLSPAAGFRCTQEVPGMTFVDPGAAATGRFRIDTVVAAHPGAQQQAGARLVTVSVCWTDEGGHLREVRARRLMVPEN